MGLEPSGRTLQTSQTTLEVIEALKSLNGARVSELAAELDMPPSTVHSHLTTLYKEEYVAKEGDIYHLGLKFLAVGNQAKNRKEAYQMAESYTERLADESECRAVFAVEEHGRGVYVYTFSGKHAVWTYSTVGKTFPLHVTAVGKAILSQLPESRVEAIVEKRGLAAETENTITEPQALVEELETIRERGFSFNNEEQLDGVKAVGVPVTDASGSVIGAFSAASPAKRMADEWFEEELPNIVLGIANEFELETTLS